MNRCRPFAALILPIALALTGAGNVKAASAIYTGTAGDGIFDTGGNWSTGAAPGDISGATTNADVATFQLTTGTTLTLNANRNLGSLTFQGISVNNVAGSFVIGAAAGPSLLLSSGGTILAGTNAFGQTVNAPLVLQNAASGTSFYTFQDDTPGTSRIVAFGGSITGAAATGATTTLFLTGTSATVGNTLNGVISNGAGGGALALSKFGTGSWQLNNAGNTFSGGLTINAGTLRMNTSGNSNATLGTGAVTMNGGALTLASTTATTFNNALVVNAGTTNTLFFRGNDGFNPTSMTGTGTLVLNGTGNQVITVTTASLMGFAGTVDVEAASAINTTSLRLGTGFDQASLANATLIVGANASILQQAGTNGTFTTQIGALSGSGTLGGSGAGSGTFTYQVGGNNASTAYSGTITNGGSLTALTKVGTGTLTLTGANSYSGLTTVNAGTLNINGVNALGGGNYAGTTFNGGTLQYATGATGNGSLDVSNIGGVAKPVTISAGGATIDTNGNNVTFANTIGNNGTGALTKAGTGMLTLGAVNTFTGGTLLNAGALVITANGGLSTGNVTLAANTTLELGIGVTAAHNGQLSALTLTDATTSLVQLDGPAGTSQDTVRFLVIAGVTLPNGTYGAVGSGALFVLPDFTGTGFLTVVPEPSTWATMIGGFAAMCAVVLRRKRRV